MTYYEELMKLRGFIAERDIEIARLKRVAEAARMLSDYLDEQKENYVVNDSVLHRRLNKALKAWREGK